MVIHDPKIRHDIDHRKPQHEEHIRPQIDAPLSSKDQVRDQKYSEMHSKDRIQIKHERRHLQDESTNQHNANDPHPAVCHKVPPMPVI